MAAAGEAEVEGVVAEELPEELPDELTWAMSS
jgi:hypothetical protein